MTKEEIELMDKFALAAFTASIPSLNRLYMVHDLVSGSYALAITMTAERRKRLK